MESSLWQAGANFQAPMSKTTCCVTNVVPHIPHLVKENSVSSALVGSSFCFWTKETQVVVNALICYCCPESERNKTAVSCTSLILIRRTRRKNRTPNK
eukprot:5985535-Amphidinium_carterae.1